MNSVIDILQARLTSSTKTKVVVNLHGASWPTASRSCRATAVKTGQDRVAGSKLSSEGEKSSQ